MFGRRVVDDNPLLVYDAVPLLHIANIGTVF